MFAPPYEMNVLQVVPPPFPYYLMEISKMHFKSHLEYGALRSFLENGFNKASLDHVPDTESFFGYECTGISNWHMFTCVVTIFSEMLYHNTVYTNGFIIEIRHIHGHYNAYEYGIKHLLSILDVKLEEPRENIRHIIPPLLIIDYESCKEYDIDHINRLNEIMEDEMMYDDMVHGALVYIGSYVAEKTKNYLFIDDGVGVNSIKCIAKLCMNSDPDSIIPIVSMMIFSEFIKINGSSYAIIIDVIIPCIPKCINNISQHLNRETLGLILSICNRDIRLMNYFKQTIDGIQNYYTHLRTIIMGEMRTRDVCAASYATQILRIL
jgi:hypothetical protein